MVTRRRRKPTADSYPPTVIRKEKDATQRTQRSEHRGHGSPPLTGNKIREIGTEKHCGPFWSAAACRHFFLRPRLLAEAVFRRNRSEETGEKREQAPALQKKKPRTESGRSFLPVYRTRSVMDSSSTESVVGFVSGHGFSRAVSLANSIPPLGAEGLWHRLQPVCLPCRWKPRISIRGSTLS